MSDVGWILPAGDDAAQPTPIIQCHDDALLPVRASEHPQILKVQVDSTELGHPVLNAPQRRLADWQARM
jgi:hypothetical protein